MTEILFFGNFFPAQTSEIMKKISRPKKKEDQIYHPKSQVDLTDGRAKSEKKTGRPCFPLGSEPDLEKSLPLAVRTQPQAPPPYTQ